MGEAMRHQEEPENVRTTTNAGVTVITIDRPRARNAVDRTTAEELAAAFDAFDADPDAVVGILTGTGGTFSAGMDLKAFSRDGERPSLPGRGFGGLTERPPEKPLIAAVEGWALAGGCEMALACDLVVAARDARFGLPEVARGLVAAAGGLLRLPKALPYPLAMRIALTGESFTAPFAAEHGLVAALAESGQALSEAQDLAARIASNGPLAVRATKRVVADAVQWTDAEAFAQQRDVVAPVLASADAQEGARAFAEKRAPVWRGE